MGYHCATGRCPVAMVWRGPWKLECEPHPGCLAQTNIPAPIANIADRIYALFLPVPIQRLGNLYMNNHHLAHLASAISTGNVILFLGAGASTGSLTREGAPLLSTPQLARALAGESGFEYTNESLGCSSHTDSSRGTFSRKRHHVVRDRNVLTIGIGQRRPRLVEA